MTTGKCLLLFFYFCLFDLNQRSMYVHSPCGLLICDGSDRRQWRMQGAGGRAKQGARGRAHQARPVCDYVLIRMIVAGRVLIFDL